MPLAIGARLGPYEIVALMGAGGMGEVYRARDTRLDRTVAVKVLPESLAGDPQFRERFDREARAISQLTHPHICALYDVWARLRIPSPPAFARAPNRRASARLAKALKARRRQPPVPSPCSFSSWSSSRVRRLRKD